MPLVMRKTWSSALVLTNGTQSGRQRAMPLVVKPTPRQRTVPLVLRKILPRQTKRGKSRLLKHFLSTWGGLGPCVGFQKRPCEKF